MIYIQIPKDDNAVGFLALAKSGASVLCLPGNTYGVSSEHLTLLRTKAHSFQEIEIQYGSYTKTHARLFNTEILNAEGVR